jgi:hypothetical protein
MKKFIVLSVNENPTYLYFKPLAIWCWRQFGWEPILFYHRTKDDVKSKLAYLEEVTSNDVIPADADITSKTFRILRNEFNGFKSETIAQVSRLYGSCLVTDGLLMTGDIDLLPLSDYWHPDENSITTYGRDLTDYHYPIGYISMPSYLWSRVMKIQDNDYKKHINRDLNHYVPKQKNVWTTDQQIITERLLEYGKENITHINRGTDKRTGYPIGRIDRSNWTLNHDRFIDAHLPHDILTNDKSFHKVMELLHLNWPKEDFKWVVEYHKQFKKLI